MVTVYAPHSPSVPFPYLHALIIPSSTSATTMPTSPAAEQNTPSVFKALGSYADRIRENGVNIDPKPASTSTQKTPKSSAPSKSSAASSSSTKMPASTPKSNIADQAPAQAVEDDGPWETVQSARVKSKHDKDKERDQPDKGSNSRNWRDRPTKEKGAGSSSKENIENSGEGRKASTPTSATNQAGASSTSKSKRATSSAPATRSGSETGKAPATAPVASTSRNPPGPPSKSAWSTPVTSQKATAASTPVETSTSQPTKAKGQSRARTAPSSPSLNGTTVANSSAGNTSAASPNLSTDTYVSSTPPTSEVVKEAKHEGQSSSGNKESVTKAEKAEEKPSTTKDILPPVTPVIPKPAPAPPTNVWAARQLSSTPATAANTPPTAPSTGHTDKTTPARLQFGELSPSLETPKSTPNGNAGEPVKIGGKKKKKDAASVVGGQTIVMDASQWPDVAQAQAVVAEVAKTEVKKDVKQIEDQQEESATTKKPKWKAIPASELLAAADEAAAAAAAAEANKRQQRKRGSKQGESSTSPSAKAAGLPGKPKKGGEGKRGEIRLPPNPNGQATKSTFKPTFGSLEPGSEATDEVSERGEVQVVVNGMSSVPLSRQTSKTSQSPVRTLSDHSIPLEQAIRLGTGPLKSQAPTHQNATAPLLQQPFASASSGHALPRPPRGGRNSFSGRGRGGGRGGRFDPNHVTAGTGQHINSNVYAQGYGMGYAAAGFYGQHAAYPAGAPGAAGHQQPMFDPMQAQWFNMQMYGRGPMPPPPTPQTVVAGLNMDPLRFYVLGQVEYYFSMQNLAMDFFLRQQMDTEGWISIAMIASFNRIKSLTPEVPMVKEMMELSSLLEVQGDHVRIRGEDAKKWVLPDAKQSPFPPSTSESIQVLATPSSESQALDGTASVATASQAGELESLDGAVELLGLPEGMDLGAGFGVDYQHKPGGVADALMKNNSNNASNTPTQAPSSSASVLNGEEESVKPEESTPGTSVVDEGGDEDKAGR